MAPYIHWFRRDLRLHDNLVPATTAQVSGGRVIPLFILYDAMLASLRTDAEVLIGRDCPAPNI